MIWMTFGSWGPLFAFGAFLLRCLYWVIPWTPIEWKFEIYSISPLNVKWPSSLKEVETICQEFGRFSSIFTVVFFGRVIATVLIWGMIFGWIPLIPLSTTIFKCMLVYQAITAFIFRRCFKKIFNVSPGGYFRSLDEESAYNLAKDAKKRKESTKSNEDDTCYSSSEDNTFTGSIYGDIYLFNHLSKY